MKATFEVKVKPGKDARLTWQEISEKIEGEIEHLEDLGYKVEPQSFRVKFQDYGPEFAYAVTYVASRE